MQTSYSYNGSNTKNNNFDGNSVGFFKLADGEEALVRFMHEDVSTFETAIVHPIKLNNRFPDIDCLRGPKDPIDNCPFCKAGYNISEKIYIHLIQYTTDPNGNVVAEAKVWARPIYYADKLVGYMNEYGPLTENLFKIRRTGSGMRDTKYEIMYASPKVYPNDVYPNHPELFVNSDGSPYKAYGRMIMKKSVEEMNQFLSTGSFPEKKVVQATVNNDMYTPPKNVNQYNNSIQQNNIPVQPEPTQWGNQSTTIERPRRYY